MEIKEGKRKKEKKELRKRKVSKEGGRELEAKIRDLERCRKVGERKREAGETWW